jgi:hypothetical protein
MAKPKYDIVAITQNIQKCYDNIRIFEDAIAKERVTIKELESYISELNEE